MTLGGVLETQELTVCFGGQVAVNAVNCRFEPGTLTALVGPNGAGKTTYFNLISGQIRPTAGRVLLDGADITEHSIADRARAGLGRAFQLTQLFPGLNAFENVRIAVQARQGARGCWRSWRTLGEVNMRTMELLDQVGLRNSATRRVSELSHGSQRKLEIALLMALDPTVYMFDEPTAGMSEDDVPIVLDLISRLRARRDRTILLVEHKTEVIDRLADRVVVFVQGEVKADGVPDDVMQTEIVQQAYLGIDASELEVA